MNYASIGLTFASPFDVLNYKPDPAPKKRYQKKRSKHEMSMITLESDEERKARHARLKMERTQNLLKLNPYSVSGRNLGKTNSEVAPR